VEINKEPKTTEFVDINQTMNKLLSKIADAIVSPDSGSEKLLIDIRDHLSSLIPVDKTITYVLTEETTNKVSKALEDITIPADKQLKEIGIELSTPEKTFKADSEIPVTEEEAKLKINQEVNANIEKTIKVIDDIIEISKGEDKIKSIIPDATDSASKVLLDILYTLLAKTLKNITNFDFPDKGDVKTSEEIDMDAISPNVKNNLPIDVSAPDLDKNENIINNPSNIPEKEISNIYVPELDEKKALKIGEFPGMETKEDTIIPPDDIGVVTEKEEIELELPEIQSNKQEVEIDSAPLSIEKNNTSIITPKTEAEKPRTPTEWYKAWGWPSNDNGLNNQQFSLFGNNLNLGDQFRRGIGSTLSFFGITSADVGRFINSKKRYINSITNAFELSVQMQSVAMTGKYEKDQQRLYNRNEIADQIYAMLEERPEKNEISLDDLSEEQQRRLQEKISNRGKGIGNERADEYGFALDDTKIDDMIINSSNRDSVVIGTGTGITFGEAYKQRTFEIQQDAAKRGTGWFRVYTRRGPKFANSQEEVKIIPFQFEPTISGDSKATEYATISTLARSQSAQVYRRSSERTISMTLDYLVVNKPNDPESARYKDHINQARNDSGPSLAVKDMTNWTEDYIYNYVLRNMRNLTLPNLIGPRYKLAPPIVQVWYGGLDATSASSTGSSGDAITDPDNSAMPDVFPTFRTNWYDSTGSQRQYRSLWVVKSVSFDFKGGKINRNSRNNVWTTVDISLTEIAPSVTDNEVLLWSKIS